MPPDVPDVVVPVPAAAIVLVRPGPAGAEVLLIRRHRASGFFGGSSTFPGGRVEPADAGGSDAPEALSTPAAFAAAALRELHEETGYLLDAARAAPVPLARWVTPALLPRRFDTMFLAARAPEGQAGRVDPIETEGFCWIRPADALARHHAGTDLSLPPPALSMLADIARDLAAHGDPAPAAVAATLGTWAARDPAPPVTPALVEGPDGAPLLALPGDPLHPDAPGGAPRRLLLHDDRFVLPDGDDA
jgi:8-oxo-dGTP pyrophosphatase MutT (NUDIX family)